MVEECKTYALNDDLKKLGQQIKFVEHNSQKYVEQKKNDKIISDLTEDMKALINKKLDETAFLDKMLTVESDMHKESKKTMQNLNRCYDNVNIIQKRSEDNMKNIHDMQDQLDNKMTREDGSRLWGNFSRFAVYDDLKELFNRVVPAINGFEDSLNDIADDMATYKLVVHSFDNTLSLKASKNQLQEIQTYIDTKVALKVEMKKKMKNIKETTVSMTKE